MSIDTRTQTRTRTYICNDVKWSVLTFSDNKCCKPPPSPSQSHSLRLDTGERPFPLILCVRVAHYTPAHGGCELACAQSVVPCRTVPCFAGEPKEKA